MSFKIYIKLIGIEQKIVRFGYIKIQKLLYSKKKIKITINKVKMQRPNWDEYVELI